MPRIDIQNDQLCSRYTKSAFERQDIVGAVIADCDERANNLLFLLYGGLKAREIQVAV